MTNSFNILVHKLDKFRKKYYKFKIVRNFLFLIVIFISVYSLLSVIEYYSYLPLVYRKSVLTGVAVFGILYTVQFLIIPFLRFIKVLNPINLVQCNEIIIKSFPEIKDKLINVLELYKINDGNSSKEIAEASINQKINEIKFFNFNSSIKFDEIKRVLYFLIISVCVTLFIYIFDGKIYAESNKRIFDLTHEFIKPAPFTVKILNRSLSVKKGEAIKLEVTCEGNELPHFLYINIEGNNYLMKKSTDDKFEYKINSVINNYNVFFTDLKYKSDNYLIKALPKPGITEFHVSILPPKYTGETMSELKNVGDIEAVKGSKISWNFTTIDVDKLSIEFSDSSIIQFAAKKNIYSASTNAIKNGKYNVFIENYQSDRELAFTFTIKIADDLFPQISINEIRDSTEFTRIYIKGRMSDDYGFTNLKFHLNFNDNDSSIALPFQKLLKDQEFYYSFDFATLGLQSGIINYYFTVTDNDEISGGKTTSSKSSVFSIPEKKEIEKIEKQELAKIEKLINENIDLAEDIKKDINELKLKNLEPNTSSWEKSQIMNNISEKQKKIEQLSNIIKSNFEKLNNFENSFTENNKNLIDKQKEIEKLMDEIFDDEMKKLMEEFQKLANNFDEKKFNQMSKEMNMSLDDLQKQMDRNLEMLKKMKVEQKFGEIVKEINEIANNEDNISKDIHKNNLDKVQENVKSDNEKLSETKNKYNKALNENSGLKKPLNMDSFDNEFKDVDESFKNSLKSIENKNIKKSSQDVNRNSEKLTNLAFSINQMLNSNKKKENKENIENLKQILSNLMVISFEQEDILKSTEKISTLDPKLNDVIKQQQRILNQSKIVKDSLEKLALRTPAISNLVNTELTSMSINIEQAIENIKETTFGGSIINQQLAITAVNNLALMLNEALENLEKKNANATEGDQQCENPGNKPGMKLMKEMSGNMKSQLQKMIDEMKKGNKMSRELGQSLMQNEMLQKMVREMIEFGGLGNSSNKLLEEINKLIEENKREIMNKNISVNTLNRQNLINTKLLEAENAEKERDFEEKRESKTANEFYSNPGKIFDKENKKDFTIEFMNRNTHKLNKFYQNKYKQFLEKIGSN